MTRNEHERAQELIALTGAKGLSDAQQEIWLRVHLDGCAACRDYQDAAGRVVRALHSVPLAADSTLVRATQMRVRSRVLELRQQQERVWLVLASCLFVGLSAAFTTPLFWRGFEWIGSLAGVSTWVWQASFAFVWIVPALVVSTLLVARGTHLVHNGERHSGSESRRQLCK